MIDFSSITGSWGYLLRGAAYTVELTVITAVLGLILGTGLALCRLSTSRILSEFSRLYTNLMRAVPLVLVLFWFFLLMPEVLKVIFQLDHPVMIGADLTAIGQMTGLRTAYLNIGRYNNPVRDLSPLANLTNLTSLTIYNTADGIDTSPVAHVPNVSVS